MLLSEDRIEGLYRAKYADSDTLLNAHLKKLTPAIPQKIAELESSLNITLPPIFRQFILSYELIGLYRGALMIGDGTVPSYADYLIKANSKKSEPYLQWWDKGERPEKFIEICDTDGSIILLHSDNDAIYAFDRGTSWTTREKIAADINLLFLAAGTSDICFSDFSISEELCSGKSKEDIAQEIADEAGAEPTSQFWQTIAEES